MRLVQKLIVIIFLYLIKLQLRQIEEERIDDLNETELDMFFKGKKLGATQALSVLNATISVCLCVKHVKTGPPSVWRKKAHVL